MSLGLLHSTESRPGEGASVDGDFRRNMGKAPHVLIDPQTSEIWYYYEVGEASKALANKPGGVETNNRPGGVYQVEIVGYAADFWAYPDTWYTNLKVMLVQISTIAGVPYIFHTDPTRLTMSEWTEDLVGWYRHSNAPENDHWDPGTLDYTRLSILQPLSLPKDPDMEPTTKLSDGTNVNDRLLWTGDAVKRIEDRLNAAPAGPSAAFDLSTVPDAVLVAELARRLA